MRSRDMHNDVDGRDDPYDEPDERDLDDETDDRRPVYEDDDRGQYEEPYQDFADPAEIYQEAEPRRSRLVPILAIVASLLAVAIAVVVIPYAIGMFDAGTNSTGDVATPVENAPDGAAPAIPDIRDVTETQPPPPAATADAVAPDVRDAAVSIAPPAQGEPPVRSAHGDWQVRCDTPAGAQSEQCVLMQFVTAEDRDNVGLTVIVLRTADGQARIMRILAPLGVLLPSGLGLKIDDADVGRAGFVRCLPNGCVAEVILEDTLLGQLQAGKTATFIIFQTPEEGIGIPISLAGFGEGFQSLP